MLKLVCSNNMRQLATQLAALQQAEPLHPLAPETVMVQSNELSRWLSLFLAQYHGVASHIDYPYPSAFIWRLFRDVMPSIPRQSSFSKDAMTWRIFDYLSDYAQLDDFDDVISYLGSDATPLKRLLLSQAIADTFDQYLMYRPEWLQKWEQGDTPHWQAKLWLQLTKGDKQPLHRANLLNQLHDYLNQAQQRPNMLPARISIFGLSALPPVYLEMLVLLAQHCDIYLFFLSPSDEYWTDIMAPKSRSKQLVDAPEQEAYWSEGHPLLASLGQQGQTFFEQLHHYEFEEINDYIPPVRRHLLGHLQADIFSAVAPALTDPKTIIAEDDDSIMVHSCHSAMREIEVLHDQLLALFERHPELTANEVVVMTPNIERYIPWIEAVFATAEPNQFIPYSLADAGVKLQSPLFEAFQQLLALPQSRFEVDSIMALLACQSVQQRFALTSEQISLIRQWLEQTHINWGLSAADKEALGLPAVEENTWQSGLDRLLMGYAMSAAIDDTPRYFDGTLALEGMSGEQAEVMAQLCGFIQLLDDYRSRLKQDKTAAQWQVLLNEMLDAFFDVETDKDKQSIQLLYKVINQLAETIKIAGFEQKISVELVAEWLVGHLESEYSQTRFMGQGVTFCGMVPMRSVPFEVICLIGMNDDSYPRQQTTVGFDLLSQSPAKKGDRLRREEDRYLFLESLLSAQSHLYISYAVGASIQDNATIPPSVLVSDLRDTLQQSYCVEATSDLWGKIKTAHPLQSFSQRYFNNETQKLFSYVETNCPLNESVDTLRSNWFEQSIPEAEPAWRQIDWPILRQFFSNPAKFLLKERLGIKLELDQLQLDPREPFDIDHLCSWSLRKKILEACLNEADPSLLWAEVKAEQALPQGGYGEQIFQQHITKVSAFSEQVRRYYPEAFLPSVPFELKLDKFVLSGQIDGLSPAGLFNYKVGKTKGRDLLALWLQHLIMNCIKPSTSTLESQLITEEHHCHFKAVEAAEQYLKDVLNYYWQGLQQPLPFFTESSLSFVKAEIRGKVFDVNKAWHGDNYSKGEADDFYQYQLYKDEPFNDDFQEVATTIYKPLYAHLTEHKL